MHTVKKALIIFVRNPVLRKVKTRIAKDLGDEVALTVYRNLLSHTHTATKDLDVDRFVFYADFVNSHDLWNEGNFKKMLQLGDDLGERMHDAFQQLFSHGYNNVAIIGSDCYDLTSNIIEEAFHALQKNNAVVGPTFDGGYYLIGMNVLIADVFTNKKWSTDSVFTDTIKSITDAGYNYKLLPVLSDVDNAEDCKRYPSLVSKSPSLKL